MVKYEKVIAGGVAGAAGVATGYPLDTVKTRMQTGYYPKLSQCITQTFQQEGLRGFYRGASLPFTIITIKRGFQFGFFRYLQDHQYNSLKNPFISGMITGLVMTPLGCPMHVVKIHIQNSSALETPRIRDSVRQIMGQEGLKGFYRGWYMNCTKDCLFGGMYLGILEKMGNYHRNVKSEFHPVANNLFSFAKGGVAGILTWTILFPIDTAKTAIQSGQGIQYFMTASRKIGWRYLWRGLPPVLIRTFPASAVSVWTFDKMEDWIR